MGAQDLDVQWLIGLGTDECGDNLTPFLIRQTDHCNLGNRRIFLDDGLDLRRKMVFTTPDDHVLDPGRDPDKASLVHCTQITGVQPTLRIYRCSRCLFVVIVDDHHTIAFGANFTDRAER